MNIVTLCTTTVYWLEHLDRFLYFAKRAMPDASIYVCIVANKIRDTPESLGALQRMLEKHITASAFVWEQEMPGRLMFFDAARSKLLKLFNLSEALYIDVDVDILDSLEGIPQLAPDAKIIAGTEPRGKDPACRQAFEAYNLDMNKPAYICGIMYMRQSFDTEFMQIADEGKIQLAGAFMPGSWIWNVILYQQDAPYIPLEYHACWQNTTALFTTRAIHFNGPYWHDLRMHCTYPDILPTTLQLNSERYTWQILHRA